MKASVALYMEVSCTHGRWVTWLPHVLQAQSPEVIDDHQLVHQHLPLQSAPHTLSSCLHTYNLFMFTHIQPVHVYTLTTCSCLHTYNPVHVYTLTNLFMFTHLQPVYVYTLTTCSCLHTYNLFMFTHLQTCSCLHTYNLFMFTHLQTLCSYTYTNSFLVFQLLSCIKKCYEMFNTCFISIYMFC